MCWCCPIARRRRRWPGARGAVRGGRGAADRPGRPGRRGRRGGRAVARAAARRGQRLDVGELDGFAAEWEGWREDRRSASDSAGSDSGLPDFRALGLPDFRVFRDFRASGLPSRRLGLRSLGFPEAGSRARASFPEPRTALPSRPPSAPSPRLPAPRSRPPGLRPPDRPHAPPGPRKPPRPPCTASAWAGCQWGVGCCSAMARKTAPTTRSPP